MKKLFSLIIVLMFTLLAVTPFVIANCSIEHVSVQVSDSDTQEVALETNEVINDICPVMGEAVAKDTAYKVEYDGKIIGFCCEGCINKFNKDPEKYIQKLDLQEAADVAAEEGQ